MVCIRVGGDPTRPAGFFELWNTTLNGLEPTIRWHSSALLGLDEINLLGSLDDREVRRLLESAVFRLCYGTEKRRYGVSVQPRSDRLCWLSTTNLRIYGVLGVDRSRGGGGRCPPFDLDTGSERFQCL
jgi:hypothetical protein